MLRRNIWNRRVFGARWIIDRQRNRWTIAGTSLAGRGHLSTYRTAFSSPDSPDGFDREWNPMVFVGTVSLLARWRNRDVAKHMSCCDRRHKCHGIWLYPMENICLDNLWVKADSFHSEKLIILRSTLWPGFCHFSNRHV